MTFNGSSKRRGLFISMLVLAGLIGGAVLATSAFTAYFRSQDPVNHCIQDPESQPFQLSVPITVIEDGFPARVPEGIGIADDCIRPVHTIEENIIRVAYNRPYNFTLGHFLYYWLGNDLLQYETTVHVNDVARTEGNIRDIILEDGDRIKIEFVSRR
ncbi:MAG: hypothetical protein M3093_01615 [Thermoproteota archaeon]|nr:hypothetical protein [Thermoproteota archaeon]